MPENYYKHNKTEMCVHIDEKSNAEEPFTLREKLESLEIESSEILSLACIINEFMFGSDESQECDECTENKRSFSNTFDETRYRLSRARRILHEICKKSGC